MRNKGIFKTNNIETRLPETPLNIKTKIESKKGLGKTYHI